jgi:quinoprotein glucose dehydrogenase
VPLGSIKDKLPIPLPIKTNLGTPNIGGPIATQSGLIFIAAAQDNYLRAFDASNGTELWKDKLPAGGQTTPMTYMAGGKQYVVITSGQHLWFQTPPGDYVVAYALPDDLHLDN